MRRAARLTARRWKAARGRSGEKPRGAVESAPWNSISCRSGTVNPLRIVAPRFHPPQSGLTMSRRDGDSLYQSTGGERGAEQSHPLVGDYMDRNRDQQGAHAAFVRKGAHERPVAECGQDFGRDAARDEYAAPGEIVKGDVSGVRPVHLEKQPQTSPLTI